MKITILQRNIEWANPQANIARADEAISCLLDADLFVLPEMFSTGFCTQPEGIAESADSETLHWMKRKAAERNCAIAGSVAVCENGNYYNRFYFVHPDGAVQHYDKKHLFTFGGEHKRFTAGTERVVVNFRGVRILLEVCYDLRFPVWSRNLGTVQSRRHIRCHHCRLNRKGAASAERIDKNTVLFPGGKHQKSAGKSLGNRCLDSHLAIPSLMEGYS